MFLLILDSLGSAELFFILLMALVFFGPRKLPQLSRSMGKHLAEFRKASEDFKRTWEREVAFEESQLDSGKALQPPEDNSILNTENQPSQFSQSTIEAVPAADSVGRQAMSNTTGSSALPTEANETGDDPIMTGTPRKQDWL